MICPTPCDAECQELCHEVHKVHWKRDHVPMECSGRTIDALIDAAEVRGITALIAAVEAREGKS